MYLLIVNPQAGNGRADRLFELIQKDPLFKEKNCRTFRTAYEGHAEKLAEQIAEIHHEHVKCIIVVGGDGTLHEVVNGLRHYPEIPVALIPTGSGNDFSRGIKSKMKGVSLFRKIVKNPKRLSVHVGNYVTNGRYKHGKRLFVNSIGFGLDGELVQLANKHQFRKWIKRLRLHSFIYPIALLPVLRTFEPINIEIEIDGDKEPTERATLVAVTNHAYYGGGMKIAPHADIKKKRFSVTIIDPLPKWKFLMFFVTVFLGKHTLLKEVRVKEAETFKITSKQAIPYQVDGQAGHCFQSVLTKAEQTLIVYWS